ncbi:hypothetical protein BH11CYA1_BH11CYA1_32240 [soil metagenome]
MQEISQQTEQTEVIGYPITLKKFIILDLITFGVFEIIWAFKHFRALKGKGKAKTFAAMVFALFLPISLFDMLKEYESKSAATACPISYNKYLLGVSFFMLSLIIKVVSNAPTIPDWVTFVITPLSLIPLLFVQRKINLLNTTLRPGVPFAPPMTWKHWVGLVIGVVVLLVMVGASALMGNSPSP